MVPEDKDFFCVKAEFRERSRGREGIFLGDVTDRLQQADTAGRSAGMPREIVQWRSTLHACWHCICTVNVSSKHAEVHSGPSPSPPKWVTRVWADFFLHSSEVKQHPLRPCNLSFHSSLNTGQKVNRGMFFACSLQAVQIKLDRSTEVTWDDVAAVRLFWHEVGGQVGLRHTEVVGKRANVKTEKKQRRSHHYGLQPLLVLLCLVHAGPWNKHKRNT